MGMKRMITGVDTHLINPYASSLLRRFESK